MPRKKIYASDAEKQAAYRLRNLHKKPLTNTEKARRLDALQAAIGRAMRHGDAKATALYASDTNQLLTNLIEHFESVTQRRKRAMQKETKK